MALERLQKIIAAAGVASRRKAEELIQQGLVSVNGQTVTELGSKADLETDSIRVNDKLLKGPERHEYVVLNKPRGYVTTVSDPEGRPTVMELVRSSARLYPVGRLDFNSEGLLLLTNDGALAQKLMKAASHIPKTYLVKVAGQPKEEELRRLRAGVSIAEERDPARRVRTAPAQIRVVKEAENPWLEVTLHEGRNRQIRKMFEEVGHHVEKIRRVRYGPLELDLPPGESRLLSGKEVGQLQRATEPRMQQTFAARSSNTRFQEARKSRPQRFRERRAEARPRREKIGWKSGQESHDGKQDFSSAPRPQFHKKAERSAQVSDRDRDQRRSSRSFPRTSDDGASSAEYRRERRDGTSSGEYRRERRTSSQNRPRDRDSGSKRFGGHPKGRDHGKQRNQRKNRGVSRFRGR